jgi:hypothetical protein
MPAAPRDELEEMIRRFNAASDEAGLTGDWSPLGAFYTDDALYTWDNGGAWQFAARGPDQIVDWVLGTEMDGLDGWEYPYVRTLIDEQQGEIVAFWRQLGPVDRSGPDGERYEIPGTGGSWFHYAGDFKWDWQRDFFDHMNAGHTFLTMAQNGDLADGMLRRLDQGSDMPGWIRRNDLDWHSTIPRT